MEKKKDKHALIQLYIIYEFGIKNIVSTEWKDVLPTLEKWADVCI